MAGLGHTVEEINKHVAKYKKVYLALMVLSAATVATHFFHPGVAVAITVALGIALIKGTMVAGYFMHLFDEKKIVFVVLAIMLIFFAVLMALPVLTNNDHIHM